VPPYVGGDPRDQLAHAGLALVTAGLVVGSGGNLSAREPGADTVWVTGSGTWLDRLGRCDFVEVRLADGTVVGDAGSVGDPVPPTTELALHLATYRARPDARAVIHLHPQTALLLDALGERIRLVTTDHVFYLRRIVRTPFRLPGGAEVAELAARAVADGTNCVLLAHHGCSVLADSVELAHKRALYLEEAARLTYRALVSGRFADLEDCPADYSDALDRGDTVSA
jgi:ribulose-5-phosphate 4-epimerase/fuculose-1-phosphate aldolase